MLGADSEYVVADDGKLKGMLSLNFGQQGYSRTANLPFLNLILTYIR